MLCWRDMHAAAHAPRSAADCCGTHCECYSRTFIAVRAAMPFHAALRAVPLWIAPRRAPHSYVPAPCRQAGLSPTAFGATAGAGDANGRMWTASNGLRARERFGTLCSVASWHAEQHAAWHVAWHAAYDSMPRGTEDWKPQTLEGPSACGVVPGRCGARSCAQAVLLTVGRSRLGPFPLTVGRVPLC